ncbi:MAG: permease prefix domain 1-containing protein [Oscillospiraceae bacterium]|nr:permease prefix domain 1-containing protein [Oscillospiraceae bacterium]
MEVIKTYLETMFSALPQTAESFRFKNELLINMEEKYNEFKAAGKSENEAVGTVISEFGNIDEIAEALGGQTDLNQTRNKQANNKAEKIIGTVASVYWPLVVGAYLLWSFLGDSWDKSWLIWPVAGLIFGAIAGGLGAYFYSGNDKK